MLIKMMNRLKKEEKGFTLVELLAVIVILAVIAAIAVPYILGVIEKSKKSADVATFHQVYEAARLYVTSENIDISSSTPKVIKVQGDLIAHKYLDPGIVLPSSKLKILLGKVTFTSGALTSIQIGTGEDDTSTESWTLDGPSAVSSTGETVKDTTVLTSES
ncbi:type II secretion system protein [Paenibacillus whitsoniae]|uniref:Pilin n=1 Tax=Paenibacillus whitsoniae TaxID=2496558 RepID=A0A430J462_9BACL|nr:prepilin-type N-terminal cleavage/methylation domain-containing protein [Paenibacillus whitsoniae]RTE01421.1 pilin [Paenibacillus whitsoniae]